MQFRQLAAVLALPGILGGASALHEQLDIGYLTGNALLVEAKWSLSRSLSHSNTDGIVSLQSFPHVIYAALNKFAVADARLSWTRGLWDARKWGQAAFSTASSGFQLSSHMRRKAEPELQQDFEDFIALMSAFSCSSLRKLDWSQVVFPEDARRDAVAVFGILPHEPLCTENFNALLGTLLPSGRGTGLAGVLSAEAVFRSVFCMCDLRMALQDGTMSMHLAYRAVFDLQQYERHGQWTLASLFGARAFTPNPLASASRVSLTLPLPERDKLLVAPGSTAQDHQTMRALYDASAALDAGIGARRLAGPVPVPPPELAVFRFQLGNGDQGGAFGLSIENRTDRAQTVRVLEVLPWYFRIHLHRAQMYCDARATPMHAIVSEFSYEPAVRRGRPARLESTWHIAPHSTAHVVVPFEREFLRSDDFPADWDRGIELPGALLRQDAPDSPAHTTTTTNTLLFTWPLPDHTMPFNAVTMSATLLALFYGAFFNMSFRRWYLRIDSDPPANPVRRLIWSLASRLPRRK